MVIAAMGAAAHLNARVALKKGWVRVKLDPADRRRPIAHLTKCGRAEVGSKCLRGGRQVGGRRGTAHNDSGSSR